MVREEVIGRYWLCGSSERKWLVQGNKPKHLGGDSFEASYRDSNDMCWINLTCDDCTRKDGVWLKTSDFEGLNFPELSPEGGDILEIEICKSGKVYWYES